MADLADMLVDAGKLSAGNIKIEQCKHHGDILVSIGGKHYFPPRKH